MIRRVIQHVRERFDFLIRYALTGALGAFIQTFFLYLWISILGFEETYLLGAVLGFLLALIVSFILQKFWTFRNRPTHHRTHMQLFWYTGVAVLNVLINIVLLATAKEIFFLFGVNFFRGWYVIVQILIVCFASAVSFFANYFITFKERASANDILSTKSTG